MSLPEDDDGCRDVPNAHTLTVKFHRFLSAEEWSAVVAAAVRHVPYVQDVEANAVIESPDELARRRTRLVQ